MKKFFIFFILFLMPVYLFSHKLNIFAYYEDSKLNVESFFSDGTQCKNCDVKVFDEKNNLIFSGKLDNKGQITINKKLNNNVVIKVIASMGHENKFLLKLKKNKKSKKEIVEKKTNSISTKISEEKFKKIIREELEKQLRPIILLLAKIQGNKTEKIISGIGYILGIFGLIMLFKRKK